MNCIVLMARLGLTVSFSLIATLACSADQWREAHFPPPNGGKLVFTLGAGNNPACASYDARNCLWGLSIGEIDFSKVRPLVCGAAHRTLYGVTGYEDPKHWCNLAQRQGLTQPAPATSTHPAGGYRMSNWSGWGRAAGIEYRYRVGWDAATSAPGKSVEAIYQLRNASSQRWTGAARSLDCAQGTLWGSTDVELAPGQTREVRVRAPNCGTAQDPQVRPNVVRAGKFD